MGETRLKDDSTRRCASFLRHARYIWRVVAWNLLFVLAVVLLTGLVGEVYFRLSGQFAYPPYEGSTYWRFVPGVGPLRPPHVDLHFYNVVDFSSIQRANSLGFFDREPIDPERARASCHISIIGDSFVEAREVDTSEKFHVRLEGIADRESPHLDLTTSAFGTQVAGQVSQLSFYDRYARRMSPDLVVLIFTDNDLWDNAPELSWLLYGHHPDHPPRTAALIADDGTIHLRLPDPDFARYALTYADRRHSWIVRATELLTDLSHFARWLEVKTSGLRPNPYRDPLFRSRARQLSEREEYSYLFDGLSPLEYSDFVDTMFNDMGAGAFRAAWGFTSLGLEQFKHRADHDGVALVIMTEYSAGGRWDPLFERLSDLAESLDIPIISQRDYIISQDGNIEDAYWKNDGHWTPMGHQWAAEAVWEYIQEEWKGECPSVEAGLDDFKLNSITERHANDTDEYSTYVIESPLGLRHRFHTPDGETWVESFPALDSAGYQSVYESIVSDHPIVRSEWDVHLYENGLTYLKSHCSSEEADSVFFLHVFPRDRNDLPYDRRSTGFENLDFYFGLHGAVFDGHCLISADLPEYAISSIRTGQNSKNARSWSAHYNFALLEVLDVVKKVRRSARQPDIRSNFDVYLDNGRLIYVRESCDADDRDLPFFLHMLPANENDLPDGREESGFDNLDFELMQKGGEYDGLCFAVVSLPEYDIASIRTGQWIRGEGNVWEASIELAE